MMPAEPRFATPRSEDRRTLGVEVAKLARQLGVDLMPWQRRVLDVALELEGDELAYKNITVTVPRQSGKTTLILPAILHRCLIFGQQQRAVYTAQSGKDARVKFVDDWIPILKGAGFDQMGKVKLGQGTENIAWHNGSHLEISASTEKSGHGRTIDMAIFDEAFVHSDSRLEQGMKPAMITRPSAQLWVVSTAGTDSSLYLMDKVERGQQAIADDVRSGTAYFEWSADPDLPFDQPSTWRSCMPALGITIREADVMAECATMDEASFRRAYLNQWTSQATPPPVPLDAWALCGEPMAAPQGPLSMAIDIAPDYGHAAIVAGDFNDPCSIEVIETRHGAPVASIGDRFLQLIEQHSPRVVGLDASGPAGSLLPQLESAKVDVVAVSGREMGQACSAFQAAVVAGRVRHRNDGELTAALAGGAKRRLGDLWLWRRSSLGGDISPAVAATLAVWLGLEAPVAAKPTMIW